MKRILALLAATIMLTTAMAGCGGEKKEKNSESATKATQTTQATLPTVATQAETQADTVDTTAELEGDYVVTQEYTDAVDESMDGEAVLDDMTLSLSGGECEMITIMTGEIEGEIRTVESITTGTYTEDNGTVKLSFTEMTVKVDGEEETQEYEDSLTLTFADGKLTDPVENKVMFEKN